MKRLAILTFALGVIVAPFQAHAQKPVEFNGMVFDPPRPEHPRINSTTSITVIHENLEPRFAGLFFDTGRV